ncbi:hypothetical protein DFH09DRAFT_1095487 [Mycena vulgaris]|nr:hypothetical protein DFH09DRAFT_1095487 [Mycena vulgaris]
MPESDKMAMDPPRDPVRRPHGGCRPPLLRGDRFPPPPGRAITGFSVLQLDVHASPIIHRARRSGHSGLGIGPRSRQSPAVGVEPIASQTLDEVCEVLEAVFAVPSAKKRLRDISTRIRSPSLPLHGKDLALEVARSSLILPIRTFESVPDRRPQLKYITGNTYHYCLIDYHAECGQVAKLASSSLK